MDMSAMAMSSSMGMGMPMSTASSAMTMATGMSMPSSSGMSDGMDMSMMSMSDMMMVFFTSTSTPLYSSNWAPTSTGAYAGTCIFLIAFTVVFHSLLAVRSNFGKVTGWLSHKRETDILRSDYDKVNASGLSAPPVPGDAGGPRRPWKINDAVARGLLDTVLAGVGYLLMLAVMTMNVGYFLSILGGVFLGSFIFGGFTSGAATGH